MDSMLDLRSLLRRVHPPGPDSAAAALDVLRAVLGRRRAAPDVPLAEVAGAEEFAKDVLAEAAELPVRGPLAAAALLLGDERGVDSLRAWLTAPGLPGAGLTAAVEALLRAGRPAARSILREAVDRLHAGGQARDLVGGLRSVDTSSAREAVEDLLAVLRARGTPEALAFVREMEAAAPSRRAEPFPARDVAAPDNEHVRAGERAWVVRCAKCGADAVKLSLLDRGTLPAWEYKGPFRETRLSKGVVDALRPLLKGGSLKDFHAAFTRGAEPDTFRSLDPLCAACGRAYCRGCWTREVVGTTGGMDVGCGTTIYRVTCPGGHDGSFEEGWTYG
jgi:hypothetical protein